MILKQYSTAVSGTVTVTNTKQNVQLVHNAATLTAILTISLPANPIDGQLFSVASALGITALTLSGGVLTGSLSTMIAAGFATWMFDLNSTKWHRIS